MDWGNWIELAAVSFVASLLQATNGFGFAVLAVSNDEARGAKAVQALFGKLIQQFAPVAAQPRPPQTAPQPAPH